MRTESGEHINGIVWGGRLKETEGVTTTTVDAFCDAILEAGWLLAAVTVPLFFNPWAVEVFEASKVSVFRSIALTMCAAWVLKRIRVLSRSRAIAVAGSPANGQFHSLGTILKIPLVMPVMLLVFSYVLSTLFSVLPQVSLWGSYVSREGLYTAFCYAVIFFVMLDSMRRKDQLDRLLTAVILTSIPIASYGLLQRYGIDPWVWSLDVTSRCDSTMGNAVYLGGYMIMVFPLTLFKLLQSARTVGRKENRRWFNWLSVVCFVFAACIQFQCVVLTRSRGPQLALIVSLFVFGFIGLTLLRQRTCEEDRFQGKDFLKALAFAWVSIPFGVLPAYLCFIIKGKGLRWLWCSLIIQVLLLGGLLFYFNISGTGEGYVGRMGQLLQDPDKNVRGRMLIWQGTVDLLKSNQPRLLVGYGPDTMQFVWPPHAPSEWGRYQHISILALHAHNEALDTIVSLGLIGLCAELLIYGTFFYYALRWLGFVNTRRRRIMCVSAMVLGACLGAFLPVLLTGSFVFSGVGLSVGFISGVLLYLVAAQLVPLKARPQESLSDTTLMIAALFSAIVGHWIEITFGFPVSSTQLYFFLYVALAVTLGCQWIRDRKVAEIHVVGSGVTQRSGIDGVRPRSRARRQVPDRHVDGAAARMGFATYRPALITGVLVVATVLFTLVYDFTSGERGETDVWGVIWTSFTPVTTPEGVQASLGIVLLLFATYFFGMFLLVPQHYGYAGTSPGKADTSHGIIIYAFIPIVLAGIGMCVNAYLLTPEIRMYSHMIVFYLVGLLGLALLLVLSLFFSTGEQHQGRDKKMWLLPFLAVLVIWAGVELEVRPGIADSYRRLADQSGRRNRWDEDIRLNSLAVRLAPSVVDYYVATARAMFGKAGSLKNREEKQSWFVQAGEYLDRARQLNPLSAEPLLVGALMNFRWSEEQLTTEARQQALETAGQYCEKALRMMPYREKIYTLLADILIAKGEYGKAYAALQHSQSLYDQSVNTYIVEGKLHKARGTPDQALRAYEKAIHINPENTAVLEALAYFYFEQGRTREALDTSTKALGIDPNLLGLRLMRATIFFRLGRFEEAVEENLKVLTVSPYDVTAHRNLVALYMKLGRPKSAIPHMKELIKMSPDAEKKALYLQLEHMEHLAKVSVSSR